MGLFHISCKGFCRNQSKFGQNFNLICFSQAEREREITIEHLADIDRLVSESLEMLKRFEGLNARVLPLMEDYLVALRSRDNTPASLLRMDKDHEKEMIDSYTNDIKRKIKGEQISIKVRRLSHDMDL